jgi:cytochrome P450
MLRLAVGGFGGSRTILRRALSLKASTPTPPLSLKPFDEIPGPKNELPFLGSLLSLITEKKGYHIFYENLHRQYGDIVKFKLMGDDCISISRADLIKEVYLTNQTAPLRQALDPWVMYRHKRNLPLGVTMQLSKTDQDEEEWRKYRRPIAKLLRPSLVSSYVRRVAYVGLDWTSTLHATAAKPIKISDLRLMTSAYGFEAITAILMGKSMGVLGKSHHEIEPTTASFMKAVDTIFRVSNRMMFAELPLWRWFNTKSAQEHDGAWDAAFALGGKVFAEAHLNKDPRYVKDGVIDFFDIMDENENKDPDYRPLTPEERTLTGIELISAGVDTTSNAAQWVLLCMAQQEVVQERLALKLQELMGPFGQQIPVTDAILQEAQLLHHVDEIFRLFPVLPTGSRFFAQEIHLAGYRIPPYTAINLNNYVASKDERHFKNPSVYDETRGPKRECPFASKTFGAGSRQC